MIRTQIFPAVILTAILTILTGFVFPLVVWGISQICFPYQANGSFVVQNGRAVGSAIIGQSFHSPRYFHPRSSAAGAGYDPLNSGGTNLGPTSKKLFAGLPDNPETPDTDESYFGVETLANMYRMQNGLPPNARIPADAVTRSASGLDPHISPKNAYLQAARVARERKLTKEEIIAFIETVKEERFLGIFGEPRVNVLRLNLLLDDAS